MLLPLRRSMLSLPPALRTSLYQQQQQQQQRAFSASSTRKSPLSEAILYCPTLVLDTIHSTGLPWHTAIPLSAVLVRALLVYHFSALPARKASIIRANLHPLTSARSQTEFNAYQARVMDDARRRGGHMSIATHIGLRFNLTRIWLQIRSTHRLGKEWGAPLFSWWRSPINLLALFTMTEAVRVKCGAREGLLSSLIRPIDKHVDPETARRAAMTPDEIMVERLEAAYAAKQAATAAPASSATELLPDSNETQESIRQALQDTTSDQLPALNTNAYASLADPTLRTEGLAWFPDLTVADTTLLLPLALSVASAFRALARPNTIRDSSSTSLSNKQPAAPRPDVHNSANIVETLAALPPPKSPLLDSLTLTQKVGLSLSVVFFFVAAKLPVAVLLYLVPSVAFGWLQSRWLDLKYPLPEVVRPCRRPVRVKVKKEFRNA